MTGCTPSTIESASSIAPNGFDSFIFTVESSTRSSDSSRDFRCGAHVPSRPSHRRSEATTSSAFSVSPLWKGTPLRSVKVHTRPSGLTVHLSTSIGRVTSPASGANSASWTLLTMCDLALIVSAIASSVNGLRSYATS